MSRHHNQKKGLMRIIRQFALNEKGMTLPMVAMSFMAMSGFVGSAVDIGRMQLVQSRLSFALDAAGLAAGSTINTTDVAAEVDKYMNANFPAGYLGASAPHTSATLSNNNMVIDLEASTTMPTTFMNIFGISTLTVTANSQVTRTATGLELVMALDNTGSMDSAGKLTALKASATTLVNLLMPDGVNSSKLWIGLVPFSQAVNIGTGYPDWMDTVYNSALNWGPTTWGGCVDGHYQNSRDITDDPPSVEKFRAYYSPSTDNRPAPNNSSSQLNANKWITKRNMDGSPKTYASGIGTELGPNAYCPQQVLPMSSNKTTILNAINSMQARGNTHTNLGAVWGWRMLSPKWRGLWGGEMNEKSLPLDYGTPHMNKALVLLTDGENTMDTTTFTAFGYLSDGNLGTTSSSTAKTKLDDKMLSVCTSLKTNGVYVYTVALGNPGSSIKAKLKTCASAENYFFDSPTAADLQAKFSAIADSLSNLRVSK